MYTMVNIFQVSEGEEGNESVIYKIEIPANRYEYPQGPKN